MSAIRIHQFFFLNSGCDRLRFTRYLIFRGTQRIRSSKTYVRKLRDRVGYSFAAYSVTLEAVIMYLDR